MTTNIIFGNIVYDIDRNADRAAFLDILHEQAMMYPPGDRSLVIAAVEGKNALLKKERRRFDVGNKESDR